MKTYIALFRGINVVGKHRVSMNERVSLMENSGAKNVKTYIQSGNGVFSGNRDAGEKVAERIDAKLGFKPRVFVIETGAFRRAVENNPFPESDGKACHFSFCETPPESGHH